MFLNDNSPTGQSWVGTRGKYGPYALVVPNAALSGPSASYSSSGVFSRLPVVLTMDIGLV